MKAEVITKSEKEHVVVLGSHEIGTSKHRFDADLHANVINNALEKAYEQGVCDEFEAGLEADLDE